MVSIPEVLLFALLFIIIPVSGYFLRGTAGSYNAVLFTLHKVCALALLVLSVKSAFSIIRFLSPGSVILFFLGSGAVALGVLFAGGILMSIKKGFPQYLPVIHTGATAVLYVCIAVVVLGIVKRGI